MAVKAKGRSRELCFGINAVQTALENAPESIIAAWAAKGREEDKRISKIISGLEACGIRVQFAQRHFLDEKTEGGVHQGIVLELKARPLRGEHDLEDVLAAPDFKAGSALFLILDGVTDPHNLGACMRSAWAAGALGVIVPRDKSAPLNPAARKAASGAADVLPLYAVTNLARVLDTLADHDFKIVGLAGEAEQSLYECSLSGPLALIMGSEESGMRRLTREKCTALAKIPMAPGVESLNVSVAAGISLFEAVRQRTAPSAGQDVEAGA